MDNEHNTPARDDFISTLTEGDMINARYRLDEVISQRKNMTTWRATDEVLSRSVVLQLIDPDDERIAPAFAAAIAAGGVDDPRFLKVLDALQAQGQEPLSYIACEYTASPTLEDLITDEPLSNEAAAYTAHQIALAIADIHAQGYFHQRLTPRSVMVTPNSNIQISGLLVDAALRPRAGENTLTNRQQEIRDLFDIGRLLYAMLTRRWPVTPSAAQRPRYGLPPAPLAPDRGEDQQIVWRSAHTVNKAVNPELSRVVDAILRPAMGLTGTSLRYATAIAEALEPFTSSTHAVDHLDERVNDTDDETMIAPVLPSSDDTVAFDPYADDLRHVASPATPAAELAPSEAEPPAQPLSVIPDDDSPTNVIDMDATRHVDKSIKSDDDTSITSDHEDNALVASDDKESTNNPPPRRRGLAALVGVIIVILVIVMGARSCGGDAPDPDDTLPNAPATTAHDPTDTAIEPEPAEARIVDMYDFDPVGDGGAGSENADQVSYAADGDPSTVWRTLTYFNNPAFGGLKPGVGIVYDLGRPTNVENVTLLLDNQPNSVQLRIPIDADPAGDPPLNSAEQWQVIAEDADAGLDVQLVPSEPVETRWVMVYFTSLPQIAEGQYRSGIAETFINR